MKLFRLLSSLSFLLLPILLSGCGGSGSNSSSSSTPTPSASTTKDLVLVQGGAVGAGGYGTIVANVSTSATQTVAYAVSTVWSPDATKIAYSSYVPDWSGKAQITIANRDGSSATQITNSSAHAIIGSFSPDSKRIVFTLSPAGQPKRLMVANIDGSSSTEITPSAGINNTTPVWSPKADKIAFVTLDDHLATIASDGTGLKTLASPVATAAGSSNDLSWSADGTKIAFTVNGTNFQVYTVNSDLTGAHAVTTDTVGSEGAVWSHDGKRLAFQRSGEIFVSNADGTNLVKLGTTGIGDNPPSWSPDDTRIAFCNGDNNLSVIGADGTKLQTFSIRCFQPLWAPK